MPQIKFETPYDSNLSENIAYGRRGNRTYLNSKSEAARDMISGYCGIANRAAGVEWRKGKIVVNILVHRPDMHGDPINLQKLIVDGIKVMIGVDDNQYEAHVEWTLDRKNPRLEITVTQQEDQS